MIEGLASIQPRTRLQHNFPNEKHVSTTRISSQYTGKSRLSRACYDTHLSSFALRTANRINFLLEKPQRRRRNLEKVSKCCNTFIMKNNMSRKCTLMPLLCGESLSRSNYQMGKWGKNSVECKLIPPSSKLSKKSPCFPRSSANNKVLHTYATLTPEPPQAEPGYLQHPARVDQAV